jgi:hypothetical protein
VAYEFLDHFIFSPFAPGVDESINPRSTIAFFEERTAHMFTPEGKSFLSSVWRCADPTQDFCGATVALVEHEREAFISKLMNASFLLCTTVYLKRNLAK